jgi:uncharacterized ubiquitin-like protein YukD
MWVDCLLAPISAIQPIIGLYVVIRKCILIVLSAVYVGQRDKMNPKLGNRQIRKVNYTRVLSLPKVWLDTVGLKDGDIVDIEMAEDGSLILRPQKGVGGDAKAV